MTNTNELAKSELAKSELAKSELAKAFGLDKVGAMPDPVEEMVMVVARPGQEQEGRDAFRRRGIGTWWPNYMREVRTRDRETGQRFAKLIPAGVMPGILLCRTRLDGLFWNVLDLAPGVVGVARRFSTEPIMLSGLDIVLIHKIEQGLNRPAPPLSVQPFKAGDKVRFMDDVMRRFPPGIVTKAMRNGHVELEVNVLSRMTPFTAWAHQLELA